MKKESGISVQKENKVEIERGRIYMKEEHPLLFIDTESKIWTNIPYALKEAINIIV